MRAFPALFLNLALTLSLQAGEPLELFRASHTSVDAWGWGAARVERSAQGFVVRARAPAADYGDVFVDQSYPLLAGAEIELDVAAITYGAYTLQILAMKGDTVLTFAEPIKDATSTGSTVVKIDSLGLPAEADAIRFKVWVTQGAGAQTTLRDLVYRLPEQDSGWVLDATFAAPANWLHENVQIVGQEKGLSLLLGDGPAFGSVVLPEKAKYKAGQQLLIHVDTLTGGTLAVQALAYGMDGSFLDAVSLGRLASPGWHRLPMDAGTWPSGTAEAGVKLWLEGPSGTTASIDRLVVLGPR